MSHPSSGRFVPGQRWLSETEPELGLGTVFKVAPRLVTLFFPATGEMRQYALENPPLRRLRLRPGDRLTSAQGDSFTVESVREDQGLLLYRGSKGEVPEAQLSDLLSLSTPQERLRHGQADEPSLFRLRYETLLHQHRHRHSPVRGFVGGRIDLLPHQLFIASETAARHAPRVLLADEVGLGKTIEASLILQRLLATGRISRVLIVLPEPLLHQWFVELLRRFNLWFTIFDEERCEAATTTDPEANPFLDEQLVLCSLAFLLDHPERHQQALAAGWEMLVIDEAHHLGWTPQAASPAYQLVESLARTVPGLLLLTATPEQLGQGGHFARLRLLDPHRYHELETFLGESERYHQIAQAADRLLENAPLSPEQKNYFHSPRSTAALASAQAGDPVARQSLLNELIDQHGVGRVMFRNTRSVMTGFPQRVAHLERLESPGEGSPGLDQLLQEFTADLAGTSFTPDYREDARVIWLGDYLKRSRNKVLLICRSREKVEAIQAALSHRLTVKTALFHEAIPLVQRDRNAAWFADPEGAQILLCSEIGSEGRNFQFAHHLVLFDLPLDPELLEQRIGRLDRIGQAQDIRIHVPFVHGSPQEVLALWYHQGLHAFSQHVPGASQVAEEFAPSLRQLALSDIGPESSPALSLLLNETRAFTQALAQRLEQGRDRLLEINSFRPQVASDLIAQIRSLDQDPTLESYLLRVFDHYGIAAEELSPRTWLLGGGDLITESFPSLPAGGMIVTCDRRAALVREEIGFLTWDHPLVAGAMEMLLGSEQGNASVALWPGGKPGLVLEAIFILETIAPSPLHADRFLPPTPLRLLVDQAGEELSLPLGLLQVELEKCPAHLVLGRPEITHDLLPQLVETAEELAQARAVPLIDASLAAMKAALQPELDRLHSLRRVNSAIRQEEIDLATAEMESLRRHLGRARVRLDALRLIWRGSTDLLKS